MPLPWDPESTLFSIELLGKRINCSIPENVFLHGVFTPHTPAPDPDASLVIEESQGALEVNVERRDGVITMEVAGENAFNMNCFRSYIGFLIHNLTPAMFLHGCGIYSILRKNGILMLGHEGSGKTTVSSELPFVSIIDDDQILLEGTQLIGIGRKAAHTIRRSSRQNVVYEGGGHRRARLGLIFLLTKELEGGSIIEIDAESVLRDPSLVWHHNLETVHRPRNYCEGKSVPPVPAFVVGTHENIRETIEVVRETMDTVLIA
ncbi:MAG: hypothetical protein JXA20_19315 [Spirochaetes bacterium]|nr:hypothetical protein [Spirochaetota bacterium]